MLARLYQNHVLANLAFLLVLVVGFLSYDLMPREQDPTINFNWIEVYTALPGVAAADVEKRVTDVLEEAVRKVSDIKFVSSTSREGISNILVRFNDNIDPATFDKRVTDLRRELQGKERDLPDDAEESEIVEVTSANAYPSATVIVAGAAEDENLRWQAERIKKDLERLKGVDRVWDLGLHGPELQVNFIPERLEALGIGPVDLADTVRGSFRDVAAGSVQINDQSWSVRLLGTTADPGYLAALPVLTAQGEVPLGSLAEVVRGRADPTKLVRFNGRPAVLLSITKQPDVNTIELVERVNTYIAERNHLTAAIGVELSLADDQTEITRKALDIMQTNAVYGLGFVLLVTWLFMGGRIAVLVCIGIPFILAGTFWLLHGLGQTLNVMVLLGAVISLGMLVDDAVVVVEAIYYRLQRGMDVLNASFEALKEVFAPVTASVLTTIAAFLPLMLMPGILGKFMFVVPLVVTTALIISLIEAYWILPAHVVASRVNFSKPSRGQRLRMRVLHWLRVKYTRLLVRAMRYPAVILLAAVTFFAAAFAAVGSGKVKMDFFASDPIRLFYINIQMPLGTPLERTLDKLLAVEEKVRAHLRQDETRAIVSYSGQAVTETAALVGEHYGQVMVSLKPRSGDMRSVDDVMEAMRADVLATPGPNKIAFLRVAGGPPVTKPISIKVRGDDVEVVRSATNALKKIMQNDDTLRDITDDDAPGQKELVLRLDHDAARRAGIDPVTIARTMRLLVDGEVVASLQEQGEKLEIRVRALPATVAAIDEVLRRHLPLADGSSIALNQLLQVERREGLGNIRHYNFRRTITVEADIDRTRTDTVAANRAVVQEWEKIADRYPSVQLDLTGELDDIKESLDSLKVLFLFGVLLMYMILGTQFRSYVQPLLILVTVPMAFSGVVFGLLVTQNPLSLYTLYGVVALAGIAVNSAIVLISAANDRLRAGMSVLHATLYAARRRVVPILITTFTTVAGLFSLATGLGGRSLLWGPVATAIVWGLVISALLTLFVIPPLFRIYMGTIVRWRRRWSPSS